MSDKPQAALREAGLARLKSGDLQQAADLLGRAALAEPNDPAAQLGLGVALQRAGSHAEALAAFARARALLPGDAAPPLHAAFSLLALGRSEAALQAAEAACAAGPNLAEAHVMQGRALLALERHADAARAIAAALRLAPQSAETWTLAAAAKRRAGDPAGAMAALQEALRLRPDLAAARKELAELERAAARDSDKLNAWRPTSQAAALGLAVEYLSQMPAFAALPFGEWSQVLFHQVAREHYLFVVDGEQKMRGFLGWTLVDREFAETWVRGRSGLVNAGSEGDCVIINAWAADTDAANSFLRKAAAKLFADRQAVYFKRHYPDGRERPMRLMVPASKPPRAAS